MSELNKKQTRQLDRLLFKLIALFLKFRGTKTLLKVNKAYMVGGEKKIFRVEIMELF